MSIFTNKQDFEDKPEILDILNKLEVAHKNQDELACGILLTKLKQKNIKIVVDKTQEKWDNKLTHKYKELQWKQFMSKTDTKTGKTI